MYNKIMNLKIKILKDRENNLMVSFSYNPKFVQKIKTIKGHHWHPDGKCWSFPNINGILERILKVFEGQKTITSSINKLGETAGLIKKGYNE
jgi:hypothetical protein